MKQIILATDHAGFPLKEEIKNFLEKKNYDYVDIGVFTPEPSDYPQVAAQFIQKFQPKSHWGILICGSGQGICIAANRCRGIRAILARTPEDAVLGRQHNDANVICLGSRFTSIHEAQKIIEDFITTEFDGAERHQRRINQIDNILNKD